MFNWGLFLFISSVESQSVRSRADAALIRARYHHAAPQQHRQS